MPAGVHLRGTAGCCTAVLRCVAPHCAMPCSCINSMASAPLPAPRHTPPPVLPVVAAVRGQESAAGPPVPQVRPAWAVVACTSSLCAVSCLAGDLLGQEHGHPAGLVACCPLAADFPVTAVCCLTAGSACSGRARWWLPCVPRTLLGERASLKRGCEPPGGLAL